MLNKCRLCLNAEIGSDLFSFDNNILIRKKLQSCVPEIDIGLLKNSLICSPCSIALDNAFQFKCQCIKSEEHIRQSLGSTLNATVIVKEEDLLTTNSSEGENIDSIVINHGNNQQLESEEVLESVLLIDDATLPHNSHWDNSTPSHRLLKDEVNIKSFIVDKSENIRETDPLFLTSDVADETELKLIHEHNEKDIRPKLPKEIQANNGKLLSMPDCRVILIKSVENQSKKETQNTTTFACNICSKSYICRRSLHQHYRIHTRPLICDVCSAKFESKPKLATHMRTHTGEKPFTCQFCNLKFTVNLSLQSHIRTRHTGEKPFACEFCDYRSGRNQLLRLHLQIHLGTKPFKCNICDYKSSRMFDFREHIRIHTGQKPYSCEFCDAKFSHRSHLQRHNRIHIGKKRLYVCKLCNLKFARKTNLDSHIRTHTGEKPYICDDCGCKFALNQQLREHVKVHMGERPVAYMHCNYKTLHHEPCLKDASNYTEKENPSAVASVMVNSWNTLS